MIGTAEQTTPTNSRYPAPTFFTAAEQTTPTNSGYQAPTFLTADIDQQVVVSSIFFSDPHRYMALEDQSDLPHAHGQKLRTYRHLVGI